MKIHVVKFLLKCFELSYISRGECENGFIIFFV